MCQQRVHRPLRERLHRLPVGARVLLEEVVHKRRDIGLALPERRQGHGDDVEPIVEVLAKTARLHLGGEIAIRRRHQPDVDLDRLRPPTRSNSRSCSTRRSLHLHRRRDLADLVEEQGPAIGQLEAPLLAAHGAVNDPFSWPKSSLSSSVSERAAQLTFTNRLSLRGDCSWSACAISSLPVPDSPEEQDRGPGGGGSLDDLEDGLQLGRVANDVREAEAVANTLAQGLRVLLKSTLFEVFCMTTRTAPISSGLTR